MSFLDEILADCKEGRFNSPEAFVSSNYNEILKVFEKNSYVDFVVTTDKLNINGQIVKNVFINLGLDSDELELLFFFDTKDLKDLNFKEGIDFLRIWARNFQDKYGFEYVLCQIDNGSEQEYYFDNNGLGPLYSQLSE